MSTATELVSEDLTDTILPCQYNDLIRKGLSSNEGEYLLLRAVLEDAIRIYLTNRPRSNPLQTRRFEAIPGSNPPRLNHADCSTSGASVTFLESTPTGW
jgi:hypothetical protein